MFYFNPVLFLVLAWRLVRLRLHKQLPVFFAYTAINGAVSLLTMAVLAPKHPSYINTWIVVQITFLSLQVLCAWEVFQRRTERIFNLGWIGAAVLGVSAAVGAGAAALTLASNPSTWMHASVEALQLSARLIRVFLLVSLILALGFFRLFPITTLRSLAVHTRILCSYFATQTAAAWLVVLVPRENHAAVNSALLAAGSLCVAAWLVFLKPEPPTQTPPPEDPGGPDLEIAAASFEQQVRSVSRVPKP